MLAVDIGGADIARKGPAPTATMCALTSANSPGLRENGAVRFSHRRAAPVYPAQSPILNPIVWAHDVLSQLAARPMAKRGE